MYEITKQDVDFILDDIRRNGIEIDELQQNLLDHLCCVIEQEMPPESDFREFYRSIIPRFFKRELREIQDETELLLTFKHYYAMKKTMIYSGAIASAIFLMGSIFKLMHWPGAGIMLVLGIGILSLLFLPLLFILKVKEEKSTKDKMIIGIATLFGVLISLATLFKVQHWPGSRALWLSSLGTLFFVFLPVYFFSGIKNAETKVNTIVSSILVLLAGGLLFTLTNLRESSWLESARKDTYKGWQAINSNAFSAIKEDTAMSELQNRCKNLSAKIEAFKNEIAQTLAEASGELAANDLEEIYNVYKDNFDIPTHFIFGDDDIACDELTNIKKELVEIAALSKHSVFSNVKILNANTEFQGVNDPSTQHSWEIHYFWHVPYGLLIQNLTQIQMSLALVK